MMTPLGERRNGIVYICINTSPNKVATLGHGHRSLVHESIAQYDYLLTAKESAVRGQKCIGKGRKNKQATVIEKRRP